MSKIKVCADCGIFDAPNNSGNWKNWKHKCKMHMIEIDEELCIIVGKRVKFMDENIDVVNAERAKYD